MARLALLAALCTFPLGVVLRAWLAGGAPFVARDAGLAVPRRSIQRAYALVRSRHD